MTALFPLVEWILPTEISGAAAALIASGAAALFSEGGSRPPSDCLVGQVAVTFNVARHDAAAEVATAGATRA